MRLLNISCPNLRHAVLRVILLLVPALPFVAGVTLVFPAAVHAQEPRSEESATDVAAITSGPATGDVVHQFFVRAVTGPHRNRSVCYVCRYGDRPVVMVFLQGIDPALPELLSTIDEVVDAHRADGLRSFAVLVTDESSTVVPVLQTMAFDKQIRTPLTAATTAVAGPSCHNLHPQAATTIVLYRQQKAFRSFAYRMRALDTNAIENVRNGIESLLASSGTGGPTPTEYTCP